MSIHFAEIPYGFEFGAAKITRMCSNDKKGWVSIWLETPKLKAPIQIYVTKTGKVRIWGEKGEMK